MASILEPYRGKRTPNETGTISVYASVNKRRGYDDNDISGLERHFYTKQQVDSLIADSEAAADAKYLTILNTNGTCRQIWDNNRWRLEHYDSTNDQWDTNITFNPSSGSVAIQNIYIGLPDQPGKPYVNAIVRSTEAAKSTSDNAMVTAGYLNQYYYDKTYVDALEARIAALEART